MGQVLDISRRVRAGELSAVETASAALASIEKLHESVNALISWDADEVLERARKIDERRQRGETLGLLAGVPVVVKDNICTAHGTTTCGSRLLEQFHSVYDAHVVERLSACDAILIGKANLDEFAMGSSTEHSAFGVAHNPWDCQRVTGGSSGGSTAAVAARMVPAALGSETGGSIRQPASFCGVVGVKPTYGRVSRYGLVAFGSSLDQIGTLANDVADAAVMLQAIAGHDPRDSTSVDKPVPDYLSALTRSLKGLRIGVCEAYFDDGVDDEVKQHVREAIDLLAAQGAELVEIELPHMKYAVPCYYIVAPAEASSNLARFDGVHFGRRSEKTGDVFDLYANSRAEGFGEEVKRRIMLGTYALSSGYHDKYYSKALKVRTLIKRDFDRAFEKVDVIAGPVTPTTAFKIGEKKDDPLSMYLTDIFTIPANLAGNCAISVPCGFSEAGLPIGLQLAAAPFAEETLFAAAHQYQLITEFHNKAAPITSAA